MKKKLQQKSRTHNVWRFVRFKRESGKLPFSWLFCKFLQTKKLNHISFQNSGFKWREKKRSKIAVHDIYLQKPILDISNTSVEETLDLQLVLQASINFGCKRPINKDTTFDRQCMSRIKTQCNPGYFYKEAAGETHRTMRAVKAPNEFGRGPVKVLYDRSLPWVDDIKYFMFLQIVG